jgi:Uma2 family endonuclease
MLMATQPVPHFTPEEYLEYDRNSEFKNEYIYGEIVPMVGATPWHGLISANTGRAFGNRYSAHGCRVFDSSVRVCLNRATIYAYPDTTVVCGQLEYSDEKKDTVTNPKIVVEVLSPTTKNYDLGEKLRMYWSIASLTDVLLIEQKKVWIEYWFRAPGGEWSKRVLENLDDILRIGSADCEIPVTELYAGVEFPA